MWIKNHNEANHGGRLYNSDLMNEPVEFNSNGTANVSEPLAEKLVEHYDVIEPYDADVEEEDGTSAESTDD